MCGSGVTHSWGSLEFSREAQLDVPFCCPRASLAVVRPCKGGSALSIAAQALGRLGEEAH